MDPSSEQGLAAPKFENLISQVNQLSQSGGETDKYKQELFEAYSYMGYYNLQKGEYDASRGWYDKLLNLDPKNKDWQIKALQSMALINYKEKNYVSARDNYYKILAIDPGKADAQQAVKDLTKVINATKKP
jgi:tetratricopeptide (TPR) repeat protein